MFDIDFGNVLEEILGMAITYLPKVFLAIIIFYGGFKLTDKSLLLLDKLFAKNKLNEDLKPFLITLSRVLLKFFILVLSVGVLGIDTSSFVAMLAAASFAVGLALQGSLSNFSSGILILFFKPFRSGDVIRIDDYIGTVHEIQIFSTVLITLNNRQIVIPNSTLTSQVVENISGAGVIRVDLKFSIAYNEDIDNARNVIWKVIRGCPFITANEDQYEHAVLVEELADSSVDLAVWVWAKSENYWDTFYFMKEYVKKAFDKAEISIPYPHLDVNLNQVK
jgi:small conductance mechanosensitive channel